jgi:AcrR family transcriptional regulator
MSIAERRERQREERYELILDAARRLAEAEGWDAVTTRRLAGVIDYSQPVLYSHFKGKAEIMAAVATRGFEELATRLGVATAKAAGAEDLLRDACAAYLDFARSRPVIYEAMFIQPTTIKFASAETPAALQAAFAALVAALGPDRPLPEVSAEVLWSALHGMVVLERSQRIPAAANDVRLDMLVRMFRR